MLSPPYYSSDKHWTEADMSPISDFVWMCTSYLYNAQDYWSSFYRTQVLHCLEGSIEEQDNSLGIIYLQQIKETGLAKFCLPKRSLAIGSTHPIMVNSTLISTL